MTRARLLVASAIAAALTVTSCAALNGLSDPAPTDSRPTAEDRSVNCDALAATIEERFREVTGGEVTARIYSRACIGGAPRVEAGDITSYFKVTIDSDGPVAAERLQELLSRGRDVWKDPAVQEVAPNVSAVTLRTDNLSFGSWDGFRALDDDLAELLEEASNSPFSYSYLSAADGIQQSGIPMGTYSIDSSVSVNVGRTEGEDLAEKVDQAWPLVTAIAEREGLDPELFVWGQPYVDVVVPSGEPLPDGLVPVIQEVQTSPLAENLSVEIEPDESSIHLTTSDGVTTYDELDDQSKAEMERLAGLIEDLGMGEVRLTAHPPVE